MNGAQAFGTSLGVRVWIFRGDRAHPADLADGCGSVADYAGRRVGIGARISIVPCLSDGVSVADAVNAGAVSVANVVDDRKRTWLTWRNL